MSAANAHVENYITIDGSVIIDDVGGSSWVEHADGNSITLTDPNGATITIQGNPADIKVEQGANGISITATSPVNITVSDGATVNNIVANAPGTTITNNGTVASVTANAPTNIVNNSGSISVSGTSTVATSGTAASNITSETAKVVTNISSALSITPTDLRIGGTIEATITGVDLADGETIKEVTSANPAIVSVNSVTGLTVTAQAPGRTALTVQVEKDGEITKQGTIFVTVHPALITSASVTMIAPETGATPQTAAEIEPATGNADYTVASIIWNEELTAEGKFKPSQIYTATVVLVSKNNKAFQTGAFYPTVTGAESVSETTTSGTSVGNRVVFTVTFPETEALVVLDSTITQDPGKTGGDTATVTVEGKTITFDGEIAYYEKDSTEPGFPPVSGNYVGVKVTAPTGITPGASTTLEILGRDPIVGWNNFKDGDNYFFYYPKVTAEGQEFSFTVKWDGTDATADTFTIKIAGTATLESAPVPVVSGSIARDPANTGGEDLTVNIDGNTVTFIDGQIKWYPEDEALGRAAGNRVGVQINAPADFDTSEVKVTIGETTYEWDIIEDGDDYFWWYPLVTAAGQEFTATVVWNESSTQEFKVVIGAEVTLEEAPDTTAPEFKGISPAEGNIELAHDENFVLTVTASDDNLYELEVDHNIADLPEFSVYASEADPYGGQEAAFEEAGVTVTYNAAEQEWTIDFGTEVTNAIVGNGGITFYLVIKDASGNQWGSMYDVTEENTFAYTVTQDKSPEEAAFEKVQEGTSITVPESIAGTEGEAITFDYSITYPAEVSAVNDKWHVDGKVESDVAFLKGATLSFAGATYEVTEEGVTSFWTSEAFGASARPKLNQDNSYTVPVTITGLPAGTYNITFSVIAAEGDSDDAFASGVELAKDTMTITVTEQSEVAAAVAIAEASKKYSDIVAAEELVNTLDDSNEEKELLQGRIQALWLELASTAKDNFALELNDPTWDTLITAIHFLDKADASGADTTSLKTYYASIESLDMSGKSESAYDISTGALVHFTGLKRLNLSGTGISEVGGLAGLTELEELNVSNNELTELNIVFIPNPKLKLKVLDASNNKLENVVALAQLAGHTEFNPEGANWNISNNPFTHEDIEGHIQLIKYLFADKGTLIENYTTS